MPRLSRCLWVGFVLAGCTGDIGNIDNGDVGDSVGENGTNGTSHGPGAQSADGTLGIGPTGIRRMTVWEYDNTLRDLLGETSRPGAALLPEDVRAPFDNDFIAQETSKVLVEAAETLSANAAARSIRRPAAARVGHRLRAQRPCRHFVPERFHRAVWPSCFPTTAASRGVRGAARSRPALRRAAGRRLGRCRGGGEGRASVAGIHLPRRARHTGGRWWPSETRRLVGRRANGVPLWGSAPEDALLDAAAAGTLDRGEDRRAQAARMLTDARARAQVDRFHALWLGYERMPLAADLVQRMRTETAALSAVWSSTSHAHGSRSSTATRPSSTRPSATHYGLSVSATTQPSWVDVSSNGRRGISSQGTFLSSVSNPGDTSSHQARQADPRATDVRGNHRATASRREDDTPPEHHRGGMQVGPV